MNERFTPRRRDGEDNTLVYAMPNQVYLDYNATAPLRPQARDAVTAALGVPGNPSSVHTSGRGARRILEDARAQVAELVGTQQPNAVFTSGATEANNIALRCWERPVRLLTSAIEHPSVIEAAEAERIPVTPSGAVDLAALEGLLATPSDAETTLVSVMAVNNETGVIQPLGDIVRLAKAAGAYVHCDAVQAAGKMPLEFDADGFDLMSLSSHKIGGPNGIGALIVNPDLHVRSLIRGGGQEKGRRAGTENIAGAAGFGAAAAIAREEAGNLSVLSEMRDRLEAAVTEAVAAVQIVGGDADRAPTVSCLALPGVKGETQVMALDLAGVAVSSGSACSSGKVKESHVLKAMGLGGDIAGSAIRVSLGWNTGASDIDQFVKAYCDFAKRKAGVV